MDMDPDTHLIAEILVRTLCRAEPGELLAIQDIARQTDTPFGRHIASAVETILASSDGEVDD